MSKRRRSLVRLTVRLTVKYQDVDSSQRKKDFIATLTCLKSNTRKFEWLVSFILVIIKYAHPLQGWVSFLFPDMLIPISADYQARSEFRPRPAVGITDVRYLILLVIRGGVPWDGVYREMQYTYTVLTNFSFC